MKSLIDKKFACCELLRERETGERKTGEREREHLKWEQGLYADKYRSETNAIKMPRYGFKTSN